MIIKKYLSIFIYYIFIFLLISLTIFFIFNFIDNNFIKYLIDDITYPLY